MMAGNPFRRSQVVDVPSATREAVPELRLDTSTSTTNHQAITTTSKPKGKVQKKVRILSPVVSPDSPAYREHDPFNSQLNSLAQPQSPVAEERDVNVARDLRKSFIDSVAKGASNPNNMQQQQQQQHQLPQTGTMPPEPPARPGQQAPYNPFSKTLATIESQHAPVNQSPIGISRDAPDQAPSKSTMDVDAFTRMLLTGSTGSSATSTHGTSSSASTPTGPSNLGDHHPESLPGSDNEDDGNHDDEQSGLVPELDTQAKKTKPPPPAHHHGRLFSRKGPQTVSFADFDSSTPPSPAVAPVVAPASPRPTLSRSSSDLNKPLPPPPPQTTSPELTPTITEDPAQDGAPQAKRPPPPPLSRRRSQLKSRPRSSSNLSRSSIPENLPDEPSLPPSMKPPPPPARRVPQSTNSGDVPTEADTQGLGIRAPPPPPSRNIMKRNVSLSRTSSSQSTASLGQQHRTSPSLAQVPPPPPPRRSEARRQSLDGTLLGPSISGSRRTSDASHRSSIEMRRFSGASLQSGGGRTPSISSVAEVPGIAETPPVATPLSETGSSETQTASGSDILADMSAFQREIDDMMAKAGSKKTSTE